MLAELRAAGHPIVLAINKVDTVKDKTALFPILKAWDELGPFAALVPVSAKRGSGTDALLGELRKVLPKGPPLFPDDMLTDRTERFLAGELIREQLFGALKQELPYATAVVVDNWEERPDRGDVVIDASIMVERDSQKGIIVGKGGAMIRDIGSRARAELGLLLGRPAHLRLHVKVAPDWTSSDAGDREARVPAMKRYTASSDRAADAPLVALVGRPTSASRRCSTAWWVGARRWSRTCRA